MLCLSQAHLLKSTEEQTRAAVQRRSVTEEPVVDKALKDGQHDRVSHSLVDKGQNSEALGSGKGFGKTPRWSGEENEGWRLIKCRQKRPGLPLVTETAHATWACKDVGKQRVTTSRVLRRLLKKSGEK
jgi:hypothetical protein